MASFSSIDVRVVSTAPSKKVTFDSRSESLAQKVLGLSRSVYALLSYFDKGLYYRIGVLALGLKLKILGTFTDCLGVIDVKLRVLSGVRKPSSILALILWNNYNYI